MRCHRVSHAVVIGLALLCSGRSLIANEPEPAINAHQVERLAGLCRLWGTVKYFHPYLAYRDIDWDKALVETIPKVEAARSPEEYRAAIDHLLSFLDDSLTHTVNPSPSSDEASLDEAEDNARADSSEPRQPYVKMLDEGTALVVANDYSQVARAGSGALRSVFEQCLEAKAIVFDLRRRPLVTQFTLSEDEDSFF